MLRIHVFIAVFISTTSCFCQQSEFLWAKKLGGPIASHCKGRNIAVDDSGNIYLAGFFGATVDFDPGPGTANLITGGGYLAKYDSSGNYQWAFKIGNYVYAARVDDSMNIYFSGVYYGKTDFDMGPDTAYLTSDTDEANVFIAKYTSNMEFVWARSISGSFGTVSNGKIISLDKSGNVFIAGLFEDTACFNILPDSNYLVSKGWVNGFFAKYDTNGNFLWAKSIEGQDSSVSFVPCITNDNSGSCYITGMIDPNIKYDFDPGPDTAYLFSYGTYYDDGFLAKYDANGNYIWAFAIDCAIQVKSYSICTDMFDNVYIAGSIVGDADFDPDTGIANLDPVGTFYTPFFAKYDSAGNYVWAKKITSYNTAAINNIEVDTSGRIAVAGYFTDSFADFDPGPNIVNLIFYFSNFDPYDAFWAVYDSSGNYVLAQSMYGNRENVAQDITFYGNNLLVTGSFNDTTCFDDSALEYIVSTYSYSDNAFFAKYLLDFTNGVNSINANSESITIYPNPFNNQFYINGNFPHPVTIELFDITGRKVLHKRVTDLFGTDGREYRIPISIPILKQGIYVYEFRSEEKVLRGKIVKE